MFMKKNKTTKKNKKPQKVVKTKKSVKKEKRPKKPKKFAYQKSEQKRKTSLPLQGVKVQELQLS